jgi:hypothetical protein
VNETEDALNYFVLEEGRLRSEGYYFGIAGGGSGAWYGVGA